MSKDLLRQIKPVDYHLEVDSVRRLISQSSRQFVLECLRSVLDDLRRRILSGELSDGDDLQRLIESDLALRWRRSLEPSLRPVINATGTLLHTNLGRAPLADEALEAVASIALGYGNLEYDIERGARGRRDAHCEPLLKSLLGCEAAVVVNNNAAAVMLVLDELARGGEAIISRGEMIEIGGSFRIPDVMQKSGAVLREVGATNRTRLSDYVAAINEKTKLILRVHPSNYRIVGFTEKPELRDLVEIAEIHRIPLVEDLGSGCLVDLSSCGIPDEPTVQASIAAGASIATFSGDKMLGGPQCGIIAGKEEYISRIRLNPLMRALRVDKLCYAALGATLQLYRAGLAWERIPVLRALRAGEKELMERAQKFVRRAKRAIPNAGHLKLNVRRSVSVMGGGSAPGCELPTAAAAITSDLFSASELEERLRKGELPVIARIENDELLLDMRSVLPREEIALVRAASDLAKT